MTTSHSPANLEPIPQPPPRLFLGNTPDIEGEVPILELMRLAREYGPIYQLTFPGGKQQIIVSGFELVDELSDEHRFDKQLGPGEQDARTFVHDGLFTAYTQEPNWGKAHNILLPNFSQHAMQSYLPMMLDIAEQLMEKWERLNADDEIEVAADMTRLTLDTISLCGFDYRFNSFYRQDPHPFVQSMVRVLAESQASSRRPPLQDKLMIRKHRQREADQQFMNDMVDRIIKEREEPGAQAADKKDLLECMLTGVDKQSGERLDDLNIRYQCITFLVAGHETTSGLLSFALYFLLRHPEVLAKAYAEVDRVLGTNPAVLPTFTQVHQLRYLSQILKESLRLWPTAPAFSRQPYANEEIIGGKYKISKGQTVTILAPMLHRDKSVWGEDAEEFDPEHFSPEAEHARPANAYKPFGTGQRSCIGRQFALQEALLVLGMLLQRFQLIDHKRYQLKLKQTLTLKPDGFTIQVKPRPDLDRSSVAAPAPAATRPAEPAVEPTPSMAGPAHHTPLLVLYGSNLGTCQDLATRIAEDGRARGFTSAAGPLDDYVKQLPTQGAVVIVTSSYNGTPPDNAVNFCHWLQDANLAADALQGVNYTVFGCGNREWAATFQAVPRLVDSALAQHGARRIYPRGEGDAGGDFDSAFQAWYQPLWKGLAEALSLDLDGSTPADLQQLYAVELLTEEQAANPVAASIGARAMRILQERELQTKDGPHPSERSTRHVEVALPTGVNYTTGDHLGVLARNNESQIRRVLARFSFDRETRIRLHKNDTRTTPLPINEPIRVFDLLSEYVEVQEVATRTHIKRMLEYLPDSPAKQQLAALAGDDEASTATYRQEVLAKRKSLIDLLEEFPDCALPFNVYLELLSPLRPRYYSISSSPLVEPDRCSITVGVVQGPAKSGHGTFEGVCSTYLSHREPSESVYAFVQDTKSRFRPPEDCRTPMIMIGPGTGLAPFRGFLQERAALKAQGQPVGKALLFFGCRHPQQDFIYEDELEAFVKQGITKLSVAFSRLNGQKTYVQDNIKEDKEEVWQLLQEGAIVYICGDASKMAPDVRKTFASIYQEKTGASEQEADQWLNELTTQNRYLVDVWGI